MRNSHLTNLIQPHPVHSHKYSPNPNPILIHSHKYLMKGFFFSARRTARSPWATRGNTPSRHSEFSRCSNGRQCSEHSHTHTHTHTHTRAHAQMPKEGFDYTMLLCSRRTLFRWGGEMGGGAIVSAGWFTDKCKTRGAAHKYIYMQVEIHVHCTVLYMYSTVLYMYMYMIRQSQ